ncbi:unnamed protein product [Coffea canephora]|uniref:Uncharacterized protein n=1 Tax=Coffea canephora TaxID=49390 RepID=A0A068TR13_COFCA|nr:unnamed protein product [Coffea canephora]
MEEEAKFEDTQWADSADNDRSKGNVLPPPSYSLGLVPPPPPPPPPSMSTPNTTSSFGQRPHSLLPFLIC